MSKYWALANYIGSELIERALRKDPQLFDRGPIHSHIDEEGIVTFHRTTAKQPKDYVPIKGK